MKQAQQTYDLNKAAELQYGVLPQLQKQLEEEEEKLKTRDLSLVHENVSDEEIAKIISRWTGIPVAKLSESERNKTLHLDAELHKRLVRSCSLDRPVSARQSSQRRLLQACLMMNRIWCGLI